MLPNSSPSQTIFFSTDSLARRLNHASGAPDNLKLGGEYCTTGAYGLPITDFVCQGFFNIIGESDSDENDDEHHAEEHEGEDADENDIENENDGIEMKHTALRSFHHENGATVTVCSIANRKLPAGDADNSGMSLLYICSISASFLVIVQNSYRWKQALHSTQSYNSTTRSRSRRRMQKNRKQEANLK